MPHGPGERSDSPLTEDLTPAGPEEFSSPEAAGPSLPRRAGAFAARTSGIAPFLAMEVMERAFELEAGGTRVAHLEVGEPEFAPPPAATEACIRALRDGETQYTDSRGLIELREAIAENLHARFGARVSPDRVLVTSGTSPAMLLVFSVLLEPGDEVLLASPHYPCYPNFIRYCGGVPVAIPTRADEKYAIDPERMRAAITPRTRAIVVSSPANPTGALQSRETLEALAGFGLPLISDEIYDGLVYDGAATTSALELDADAYVLDGFSKRYAMTGFRLGWVVAPLVASRTLQVLQQNLFISASRFVQHAGIAALREGAVSVESMRRECEERRGLLAEGLRQLGFGIPFLPEGAFYILADASRFGSDSLKLAFEILETAHVGVTPGIDFGEAAEGMLRFCYAIEPAVIEEALERLGKALPRLEEKARDSRGSRGEEGVRP